MYVDIIPNRGSRPAVLLRESYRDGGRIRKRTLANLSQWPLERVRALRGLLREELPATGGSARAAREASVKERFELLSDALNERARRLLAGAEARSLGRGGIAAVARATGLAPNTIQAGIRDLRSGVCGPVDESRVRRKGAGRRKATEVDPALKSELGKLVEPATRGEPDSPLLWTCKSLRHLANELTSRGHRASRTTVGELLHGMGYSLQANRKTREGTDHPDRNAQFEHINEQVKAYLATKQPAISVDTKKKELVGEFKNGGREWHAKGQPEDVRVHDFMIPELGRAIPYGVYDIGMNSGWVSVGTDHDTATFAVETIRRWWRTMGKRSYPEARRLLITADGGGSNGARIHLWKVELQELADELDMPICVSHLPPGTSKWNKIEHRLFSFITQNWRGRPLVSHEVIVKLIAGTTTATGLKVRARLDRNRYPAGEKVDPARIASLNIERNAFHGDWNYTIRPRQFT